MKLSDGISNAIDPMDMVKVPDWIKESVIPRAREEMKPLLDIYAELLILNEKMDRIESILMNPWYRRFWVKVKSWFTMEHQ